MVKPFVKRHKSGVSRIRRDNYSNKDTGVKWWTIRNEVFKRDNGKCQDRAFGKLCLKPGVDVHHILALTRGGTTTKANLITLCHDCHARRHSHMR